MHDLSSGIYTSVSARSDAHGFSDVGAAEVSGNDAFAWGGRGLRFPGAGGGYARIGTAWSSRRVNRVTVRTRADVLTKQTLQMSKYTNKSKPFYESTTF